MRRQAERVGDEPTAMVRTIVFVGRSPTLTVLAPMLATWPTKLSAAMEIPSGDENPLIVVATVLGAVTVVVVVSMSSPAGQIRSSQARYRRYLTLQAPTVETTWFGGYTGDAATARTPGANG
jgi:hypothetical protein